MCGMANFKVVKLFVSLYTCVHGGMKLPMQTKDKIETILNKSNSTDKKVSFTVFLSV